MKGVQRCKCLNPKDYGKVGIKVIGLSVPLGHCKLGILRTTGLYGRTSEFVSRPLDPGRLPPCVFLAANGLRETEISQLWDNIALTDKLRRKGESLRIISREIQHVNLVGDRRITAKWSSLSLESTASLLPYPFAASGRGDEWDYLGNAFSHG